jgi:hypothetical protein
MRVNKYTATLITFFLSAVVHELSKDTLLSTTSTFLVFQNLSCVVNYGSDLVLFSHVDAIQKAARIPALLANVANTSGSTE